MKKPEKLIIISVFVFLAAGYFYFRILAQPITGKKHERIETIEVPSGTTVRTVTQKLYKKKLIRNRSLFYLTARYPLLNFILTGHCNELYLKSGLYRISTSMSIADIFNTFSTGRQDYIRVSFPEGLTISLIAVRLENAGVCSAQSFKAAATDAGLLKKYTIPGNSFEGYLFPDTYFLIPEMEGNSVVIKMVDNFFIHIQNIPLLQNKTPQQLNEKVILASIVEREYRVDEEAPLIASVFENRQSKNIGLYSCATIAYIITEIEGKQHPDIITYKDLQINSPYNTYKWAALPPGAISNPGMVALRAAADPPKTNYYYFRLIDPETGRHVFSKKFSEHINQGNKLYTKKVSR